MFRKSSNLTINNNDSNRDVTKRFGKLKLDSNANNNFKFDELNLDNILIEFDAKHATISPMMLGLTKTSIDSQNQRHNYLTDIKTPIFISPAAQIVAIEALSKKQMLFPSVKLDNINYTSKVFTKYIPLPLVDQFIQWNKYARKRPHIDIDDLINKCKPGPPIKQLKTDKFRKGFDIVPYYLQKKSKKTQRKTSNVTDNTIYDNRAVLKAFKVFHTEKRLSVKVCFLGPSKSGKSTLIASLLMSEDQFDLPLIKKSQWEAKKAGVPNFGKAWLLDTCASEHMIKETIVPSTHVITKEDKVIHLTDTPGNESYFHETLRSLSNSDLAILVIDLSTDFQADKFCSNDYITRVCKLLKVFRIDKLSIVLTNTSDNAFLEVASTTIRAITSRYLKHYCPIVSVSNLHDINKLELSSLLSVINQFEVVDNINVAVQTPLTIEVIDIHKPIDSSLPVVVGRVLSGGLSSGLNNQLSRGIIVPGNVYCTVKSMKVDDYTAMKTRTFAFAGDLVELSLPEIVNEDSIKRGSIICHPTFYLSAHNEFVVKLMIMTSYEDHVSLIRGSLVYIWTRTKSCFARISKIDSVEFIRDRSKVVEKRPRLIADGVKVATVRIKTEELILVEYGSLQKLDVCLLFHQSVLFAAGRFLS